MPINCCQNTTATTTFLPVTSCCCCCRCSCSNPVEKPAMQKATIESRAMRDAVANGQMASCCAWAATSSSMSMVMLMLLPDACCRCCQCRQCCCRLCCCRCCAIKLSARVIKTESEKRNQSEKRKKKKQFEPDCSSDYLWMYIKHMMTIRGVKHPDKTLKYPESRF